MVLHERQVGVVAFFAMVAMLVAVSGAKTPSAGLAIQAPAQNQVHCMDPDSMNAYVTGVTTLQDDHKVIFSSYIDTCTTANGKSAVVEYSCRGSSVKFDQVPCVGTCFNGACQLSALS